ncbi:hypothetical protein ACQPZQ_43110 [Pseudonocardia sp. CA-142604]|uniref:hypothetical protein n=1 Tax=Pseudonocardia sp. CA-142604 TaxID=3240024 RepID=UPI003D8B33FA
MIDRLRSRVATWWLPDGVEFIDEVPKTGVGKFSEKDPPREVRRLPGRHLTTARLTCKPRPPELCGSRGLYCATAR